MYILKHPHITEKATLLQERNTYTFEVNSKATKYQISAEVEKLFDVEVASVRVITRKGKDKRVGRKMITKKQPNKKIAYITLSKGTISIVPKA